MILVIDKVYKEVEKLLASDNSGHGMNHINRVVKLASVFADSEGANKDIVTLIALLHDVDDYKLSLQLVIVKESQVLLQSLLKQKLYQMLICVML